MLFVYHLVSKPNNRMILYIPHLASPDGSTRLFTDKPRPRVEVLYSNRWGTICDTQWEINDAAVICNAFDRGTATSFPPTTIQ